MGYYSAASGGGGPSLAAMGLGPSAPAPSGGGGWFSDTFHSVTNALDSMHQGALRTIEGVSSGDVGESLSGLGILGAGAAGGTVGALAGGSAGAMIGANLGAMVARRGEGAVGLDTTPLDTTAVLGITPAKGLLGTAERFGLNIATDPNTYIAPGMGAGGDVAESGAVSAGAAADVGANASASFGNQAVENLARLQGGETGVNALKSAAPSLSGAGADAAQAGTEGLRLRIPVLSKMLEKQGIGASIPLASTDSLASAAGRLDSIPVLNRINPAIQDAVQGIQTKFSPSAWREAGPLSEAVGGTSAVDKNSIFEAGRQKMMGASGTATNDFIAEHAAASAQGPEAEAGMLNRWADKIGYDASPDLMTKEEMLPAVKQYGQDLGARAFDDHLAANGIPAKIPEAGQQGASLDAAYDFGEPQSVYQSAQDQLASDRPNLGQKMVDNPEYTQLRGALEGGPSLATGPLNKLYRRMSVGNPLNAAKFGVGDIFRSAIDPEVGGVGALGEARSIQAAEKALPADAVASVGVDQAARDAMPPEMYSKWRSMRENNVVNSNYMATDSSLPTTGHDTVLGQAADKLNPILGKGSGPFMKLSDMAREGNFLSRFNGGASAEDAAAGMRGAQFDFTDATPTMAAARKSISPSAVFKAHSMGSGLVRMADNPSLMVGAQAAERQYERPDNGLPQSGILGTLANIPNDFLKGNPALGSVTDSNPLTAGLRFASGDVKGAGDTMLHVPGGPTVGGLSAKLAQQSELKGRTQNQALGATLYGTVPGGGLVKDFSPALGIDPNDPLANIPSPDLTGLGQGLSAQTLGDIPNTTPAPKKSQSLLSKIGIKSIPGFKVSTSSTSRLGVSNG